MLAIEIHMGPSSPKELGPMNFLALGLGYTRVMSPMNSADDSEILRETGTSFFKPF